MAAVEALTLRSWGPFTWKEDDPSARIIRARYIFSFQFTCEGLCLAPVPGSSYPARIILFVRKDNPGDDHTSM